MHADFGSRVRVFVIEFWLAPAVGAADVFTRLVNL
jgi:hypothetical protein